MAALATATVSVVLLLPLVAVLGVPVFSQWPVWLVLSAVHFVVVFAWIELLTSSPKVAR